MLPAPEKSSAALRDLTKDELLSPADTSPGLTLPIVVPESADASICSKILRSEPFIDLSTFLAFFDNFTCFFAVPTNLRPEDDGGNSLYYCTPEPLSVTLLATYPCPADWPPRLEAEESVEAPAIPGTTNAAITA